MLRRRPSLQQAGQEALAPITDNQKFLEAIVAPLSGNSSAAAHDDTTREALAEAVLLLVGTMHHAVAVPLIVLHFSSV